MISVDKEYNGYYMLGIRGEYTLSTNLDNQINFSVYNLVDDFYVNKFVYGVSVGGGVEMKMGENQIVFVEVSVNPDLSKQYDQPESLTIENPNPVASPFPQPQFITITPQEVRNVSLEVKVGIKFARGYYYEDEEY